MKRFEAFIKTLIHAMIIYIAALGFYFALDSVFDFPCGPIPKWWFKFLDIGNFILIIISFCISFYFNMIKGRSK